MQITSINGIEKKFHEGVAQIQQKYGNKDTKIVYEPIISKPDECRPIISQRKPPQIDVNIRNGPKDPTIRRARRLSLPMVGPLPKFTNNETKPAALTANEKTHNTNPKLLQESLPREQITITTTGNNIIYKRTEKTDTHTHNDHDHTVMPYAAAAAAVMFRKKANNNNYTYNNNNNSSSSGGNSNKSVIF